MFQGFNESTIRYFEALRKENSKSVYKENERLYLEGVKYPLEELYFELYGYFDRLDRDLPGTGRKCLSSAYNDARFCREAPVKEYFYIRFKRDNKKNAPGFFFDASLDQFRYGLTLYHPDAKGMNAIRDHIMKHRRSAKRAVESLNRQGLLEIQGEKYKRESYPGEAPVLRELLERKALSFTHAQELSSVFFERKLLERLVAAFDSAKDIYLLLREALRPERK